MIHRIVQAALRQRFLVLMFTVFLAVAGILSFQRMPVDAYPDLFTRSWRRWAQEEWVYRARDTRLGRDVAIKVLPPHLYSNPDLKQRFEREARTVRAISEAAATAAQRNRVQDGSRECNPTSYLSGENSSATVQLRYQQLRVRAEPALCTAHQRGAAGLAS